MRLATIAGAAGVVLAATIAPAHAANTLFDDVSPLTGANVPIPVGSYMEGTNAFLLPSGPGVTITQTSIADRGMQLSLGQGNTGSWDMIDTNRTGPDANRYLFMPFETGTPMSGMQRVDLWTGQTTTLVNPGTQGWARADASRWSPWGTWLGGEENFTPGQTGTGRLFEVTNPVTATQGNGTLVQRNSVVPLVSHEGLAFDSANNFYFIDENSSGSFYKFTSANPNAANGSDFFGAGTVFAAIVPGGAHGSANGVANTTGALTWAQVSGLDGRAAADAVNASAWNRPEDMEIKTLAGGGEMIVFAATGTDEAYSVNLATNEVKVFASQSTINIETGMAVGGLFNDPDNIAIDAAGNFYIVEDQETPNADVWLAKDADNDGVAEYVQRWVAMQVTGAEPSGLFFSLSDPNLAYINIQHADSGNDRTIMLAAVPEPTTYAMMLAGLGMIGFLARRRLRG